MFLYNVSSFAVNTCMNSYAKCYQNLKLCLKLYDFVVYHENETLALFSCFNINFVKSCSNKNCLRQKNSFGFEGKTCMKRCILLKAGFKSLNRSEVAEYGERLRYPLSNFLAFRMHLLTLFGLLASNVSNLDGTALIRALWIV